MPVDLSLWGLPSVMPICKRLAWSTTIWSIAFDINKLRPLQNDQKLMAKSFGFKFLRYLEFFCQMTFETVSNCFHEVIPKRNLPTLGTIWSYALIIGVLSHIVERIQTGKPHNSNFMLYFVAFSNNTRFKIVL